MRVKLFWLFCILLFATMTYGQSYNRYKYEFTYGIGASNFMGDVSAPKNANQYIWVKFFNTIGTTANVGLKYSLNERNTVSAFVFGGQLFAEDPIGDEKYWSDGRKVNTFFIEMSARYELTLIKEKKKRTVYRVLGESTFKNLSVPTYLFIGGGLFANYGTYSHIGLKSVESENFFGASPVMPLGIGFKFRLTRMSYVNVEAGARFVLSDKLDNIENGWYDQYQFITVNYIYKLRSKPNGLPRFKR